MHHSYFTAKNTLWEVIDNAFGYDTIKLMKI